MVVSSTLTVLLFCLVLCTQALEQRTALGRRSNRRNFMASVASFLSNVDRRLAAVEAKFDNSTEERVAKIEGQMQDKLQGLQDGMQRLESMMNVITEKMAEIVEAKASATEESAASLEATKTEPQSSFATSQYQYQYRFGRESSRSSGEEQRMAKLESELTRLQEKMSALDKHLQDNDVIVESLQNASMKAMEGAVHSIMELVAALEQSLRSAMKNNTKFLYESTASLMDATFFTTMMSNLEACLLTRGENNVTALNASMANIEQRTKELASRKSESKSHLLAHVENNTAALNAFITRMEQTTKDLATSMSIVEDKLDNATTLQSGMENVKTMLKDLKATMEEFHAPPRHRRSCQDYLDNGHTTSGVYSLELEDGQGPIEVYCDMRNETGWVVFQRRQDGSVDFYRNWTNYEDGFGDLRGEFWLGNKNIHRLTSAGLIQLRVDLQAWNGATAFASYLYFSVGDTRSSYRLSVSGYWGTAGDSLARNNGHKFSTYDQDHDARRGFNYAQFYKAAWWYGSGSDANLNAQYGTRGSNGAKYVVWLHWLILHSLQRTELKLK